MKPQQRRCRDWWIGGPWPRPTMCGAPVTHRVVARWKSYPGWPERELMCAAHADLMVRGNSPHMSAVMSAYRIRKGSS